MKTDSVIEILPNNRGGYGLRIRGDTEIFGNYPTAEDARRHADRTFRVVELLDPSAELSAHSSELLAVSQ